MSTIKVNFYILDTSLRQQAWLFACKLAEKVRAENENLFIHTASADETEKLDQLLWTYRDDSFLPHEPDHDAATAPILISHDAPLKQQSGTLINFHPDLPVFHSQFNRIIEIVYNNPDEQQLARTRYKQYRDANYELQTHKLKATES